MPDNEHEKLCDEAKKAINKVFSDHSVSQSQTRESLRDLIDEIRILIDSLKD